MRVDHFHPLSFRHCVRIVAAELSKGLTNVKSVFLVDQCILVLMNPFCIVKGRNELELLIICRVPILQL